MKPLTEVLLGVAVGLALGVAMIWGVIKLGDYIVEHTHESHRHSIPNRGQACWPDGQATAVVPPAVAQVVWL